MNDAKQAKPEMIMRLVIARGDFKGRTFEIEEGNNLIGRWDPDDGAFPEIDVEEVDPESKVSRKHAVILRNGTHATIEDIGSRNGTYVNRGNRLEAGKQCELHHGDEVVVGKIFFNFEVLPAESNPAT